MKFSKIEISIAIVLICLFIIVSFFLGSPECESEKDFMKYDFNSIVDKKYIDTTAHNYKTIDIIKNGNLQKLKQVYFFDHEKSGFYDYVRVGDSIIKEKNSMDIRVIRGNKDTVFTIDYGCEKYP